MLNSLEEMNKAEATMHKQQSGAASAKGGDGAASKRDEPKTVSFQSTDSTGKVVTGIAAIPVAVDQGKSGCCLIF